MVPLIDFTPVFCCWISWPPASHLFTAAFLFSWRKDALVSSKQRAGETNSEDPKSTCRRSFCSQGPKWIHYGRAPFARQVGTNQLQSLVAQAAEFPMFRALKDFAPYFLPHHTCRTTMDACLRFAHLPVLFSVNLI